jgi:mannose-6-phosphate isomerase-like protein (cupin superfamily)/DNA-binding Xre family transcriptional regulator
MNLGKTINRLRAERKMTLLELSKKSGVALASLSRIENGKMTGTLESHMKICDAFGLSLPELYSNIFPARKAVELQKGKSRTEVFIHDKNSSSEMLASKVLNRKMMPVLMKLGRGGSTAKEETRPGIDKFIFVVDGAVEAQVGDEKYSMRKGDSIYFEAKEPHRFRNTGPSDARIISVTCPPAL